MSFYTQKKRLNFSRLEGDKHILYTKDNTIKAVSFEKLIELLTSPKEHDPKLLYDILLTYRSITTSFLLLDGLAQRFEYASVEMAKGESKKAKVVCIKVMNVMKHWINEFWFDFSKDNPELANSFQEWLQSIQSTTDPDKKKTLRNLDQLLQKRMLGHFSKTLTETRRKTPKPMFPKNPQAAWYEWNSEEIARQLTLIEWSFYKKIQPWELLDQSWSKSGKEQKSPNVIASIERFNLVSGFVKRTICTCEDKRKRIMLVKKFIDVAEKCRSCGNYNGVLQVLSAIKSGPIFRLKASFDLTKSERKVLDKIDQLALTTKNYKNLRDYLKKVDPPCIPYLGMYLTDLIFLEEGNPNEIQPPENPSVQLINFDKRRRVSRTIQCIKQFQQMGYYYEPVKSLQGLLEREIKRPQLDEDTQYQWSWYLEPREGKPRPPRPGSNIKLSGAASNPAISVSKMNDRSLRRTHSDGSMSESVKRGSSRASPQPIRRNILNNMRDGRRDPSQPPISTNSMPLMSILKKAAGTNKAASLNSRASNNMTSTMPVTSRSTRNTRTSSRQARRFEGLNASLQKFEAKQSKIGNGSSMRTQNH